MSTLSEFLLARIAEDVAIAQAGGLCGIHWQAGLNGYDSGAVTATDGPTNDTGIVVYDEGRPNDEQAAHIARHDPYRVLAECAAKRLIVERASGYRSGWGEDIGGEIMAEDVLSYLALPYADHPHYDEAWRP